MCLCGVVIALLTADIVIKTYVFNLRLHIYELPSHDKRCRWQRPIGEPEHGNKRLLKRRTNDTTRYNMTVI